ncbi:MAG: bifunctional phosphoribosyl-AMP cyclohydrolase/phosphoribosyl-ATP diphosphatase HisIE [Flavobacteriales bacterium]|nr:bifunctional phosphoribosyl-AMP cyclohydrolase/phosphoribosyl-ATP diphosphatase [Flavobacteriaceae bacterium]RZP11010.1 MAG: bifunctional phosphoribosyl-AMP cyclohydrolase/phosphoribosyl-ATP diphosphatase HisIE [Flavobacteriales bacterium]
MDIEFLKNRSELIPAIIQDNLTKKVLMLGYMNHDSLDRTIKTKKVTFFSRSRNSIWVKGETSGNFLNLVDISLDCDKDTLLIKVSPEGPVCHEGSDTCWSEDNKSSYGFLSILENIIDDRKLSKNNKSYVSKLFSEGQNRIIQKVGEEAVELLIESKDNNKQKFIEESADLLFHFLILLNKKNLKLDEIVNELRLRSK